MDAAYDQSLRTIADSYEEAALRHGGKSLARVATIVVNNGSFFKRLRSGKPFLAHNLDRFAAWFRDPENWPDSYIPAPAAAALVSIGRPPLSHRRPVCGIQTSSVSRDILRMPHEVYPHG